MKSYCETNQDTGWFWGGFEERLSAPSEPKCNAPLFPTAREARLYLRGKSST